MQRLEEINPEVLLADGFEDAKEYFDYNVAGSWVGDNTPVYISLSEKGD
jgi:hypothetical protein